MARHLVVCTDGTWNRPDQRDHGLVVPSNVVKVARAVAGCADGGVQQRVYYDTGVGTGGLLGSNQGRCVRNRAVRQCQTSLRGSREDL